ncbi:MAG TPA: hypothetical protein ENJ95_07905 [Bacteroidetes bacterium]|nr:hypothetical protein [Bacteroidota bacterium]
MKNGILLLICFWLSPVFGQVPDSIASKTKMPVQRDSLPVSVSQTEKPAPFPPLSQNTAVDSTKKRNFIGRIFKNDYPNPKKALYLSLAIPGGGQIYNKRWWKLPLVYGGYFLLIRAIDTNTKRYHLYRDAYIAELAGEPHPFTGTRLDAGDLRRIRDGYDKNRQVSYIGTVILHIVQTAEAFVDCHLKTFDVSDDLSMRVGPKFGLTGVGDSYLGIGLTFQLSD